MSLQALTQINPSWFFHLPKFDDTDIQPLNTQIGKVTVSNEYSGRLSVTIAEGDRITLAADLETDFRAINFRSKSPPAPLSSFPRAASENPGSPERLNARPLSLRPQHIPILQGVLTAPS